MSLPEAFLTRPMAHRGLHDRANGVAENSRSAFQKAIAYGYGIELDVQMSSDNQALVFHDYDLRRLTEASGAVRLRTGAELSDLKLSDSQDYIDTLGDILRLINGAVPILIEIKDQDGAMGPKVGTLEKVVSDALRFYSGPAAVMSFNPHSVARMADFLPDVPRGLVTSSYKKGNWPLKQETRDRLREIPDFEAVGASFISHEYDDLDRSRVAELKAQGASIFCWTVRSADEEKAARKVADNVTFEDYLPT
ncbi:MAG: glycerophosphodiester phosphodiesterase family protein [Pseudomonadota bacterium]